MAVPAERVSWHRVRLPKTPAGKLEAVLAGLLEEHLLDDPSELHFAIEPGVNPARVGAEAWVAVCHKSWLRERLDALTHRGWRPQRIVPAATPQADALLCADVEGDRCRLVASTSAGVVCLPLEAGGASAWMSVTRGIATPAAVSHVERVLPHVSWTIQPIQATWLMALASRWDLAQHTFRLSERLRWQRAAQHGAVQLLKAPAWRPTRWGLASLLVVQVVGLNVVAYQARQQVAAVESAVHATLTTTFPRVTLVLDPALQMQREVERLRAAYGQLGGADLEHLLHTLGQLQPPPRLRQIDYVRQGGAQLSFHSLRGPEQAQITQQLERAGWTVGWSQDQAQVIWGRTP